MKIISVRFANLNSLPGPYLIRFDAAPLVDSGLFAITGPTGAGKSTLLDAIAVGLYGRVPRHDRQVGEMVSRHAAFAYSEVEFEVMETDADTGIGGRVRYRSRWEVKRKSRGEDKGGLGQDAMTLVLSRTNAAVVSGKEAVPARVGELSGLDFGQFEQSVLLSQGKFARFLHAPEKERSALLEKMTNVGIYSRLSVAAFDKAKEEELKSKLLAARLAATRLLTDEERGALETELTALHEAAEGHHLEQQELSVFLTWRALLDQLEQQTEKAVTETEVLRQADATLQTEFARLDDHARAAALATPLALAEEAARRKLTLQKELDHLQEAHPDLATAHELATAATRTAKAGAEAAEAEENRLRPILDQAREADLTIAAAARQLADHQQRHVEAQRDHDQRQTAWQEQEKQINGLNEQEKVLSDWLLAHNHEADLTVALGEIKRDFLDLASADITLAKLETQQTAQLKALNEAADALKKLQAAEAAAVAQQKQFVEQGRPHRAAHNALLLDTSAAALLKREADLKEQYNLAQRLLPLAQTVAEQTARAEALATEAASEAPLLLRAGEELTQLKQRCDDGEELLNSFKRELRAQQTLADLNTHRQQLQPGEPCPLCGALEHAFAADFAAEASEAELRVKKQQQALKDLETTWADASQALVRRQTEQDQRHARHQETTGAAAAARAQLAPLAAGLAPPLPDTADPQAVQQRLNETAGALVIASEQCQQLARLDATLRELKEAHDDAKAEAVQAKGQADLAQQRHETAQQELAKLKGDLAEAREQAGSYRTVIQDSLRPHALTLPAAPPYDGLLATLQDRADTYATQQKALADLCQTLTGLRARHAEQATSLDQQRPLLATAAAALTTEAAQLQQLREARQSAYAGPDPAAEQENLRLNTQALARTLQAAQAAEAAHQQTLTNNRTLAQKTLQDIDQQNSTHTSRQATLAAALTAAGFGNAAEAQALLLPPDEADRLILRRQQHRTDREAARLLELRLSQELADFQAHALTALSTPALSAQLQVLAAADDILQQKLGAVANQLDTDDKARAQQAEGQRELALRHQEEQRWQDLSEQIGSAKGDKFSQFAQGLTLAHLAQLANLRLRQLTGRYTILKTPNRNLELQIIDHDQAGAIRPMASLSGGESFLVSLALALGLSELAGHKARIESLFIDEGFGTLDPDALNTALDALERLQHSGKMIGIISHVTDLKERIGTQIRVRPGAGGNSTVHVVDVLGDETSCAV